MNTNIVLAFLGGAALASGIVYMAVRPDSKPTPKPIYVASQQEKSTGAAVQQPAADPAPSGALKSPVVSEQTDTAPTRRTAQSRRERVAVEHHHQPAPLQIARVTTPAPGRGTAEPVTTPPVAAPPIAAPAVTAKPVAPAPVNTTPEPARVAAAIPPPPAPAPEPNVEPRQPHSVTLTAGTPLTVRLGETLSTQRQKPGDTFMATLDQPLVVDGFVIAERGARCEGRVVESDPGGRVRGLAHLEIELTGIHTSDGQRVRVRTTGFGKDAEADRKKDAAKVGGGAALGAIIGAIAGGGRGAAIGAGVGGAAGAGDVAMTRGKAAELRVETRVTFRVQDPVTITERLD